MPRLNLPESVATVTGGHGCRLSLVVMLPVVRLCRKPQARADVKHEM